MTDSLQTLWQDTPPFDVDAMVARLNKNNRDIRSLNAWSSIGSLAVFIVLVALEWTGNLHTGGMMTILGTLCFIAAGTHYVLAKRKLQRAFSREPSALVEFMIQRTKAAINLGRGLYILPIPSLCTGYLLGRFTPDAPSETPMPDWIEPMVIVIALTFITVPTVIGIWFTRMKQRELNELRAVAADLDATD